MPSSKPVPTTQKPPLPLPTRQPDTGDGKLNISVRTDAGLVKLIRETALTRDKSINEVFVEALILGLPVYQRRNPALYVPVASLKNTAEIESINNLADVSEPVINDQALRAESVYSS